MEEIKMKVIYNKKYEKNAPADKPPEQIKTEVKKNNNISLKDLLVIFIISLLIFPILITIKHIIKIF